MTRTLRLAAAACLLAAPGLALDEAPIGEWTVMITPSAFAPRLHGLDNALQYYGVAPMDALLTGASGDRGEPVRGIGRVYWGVGGKVGIGYQINEDIRAGVMAGVSAVLQHGRRIDLDRAIAIAPGSTTYVANGTWDVTEKFTLPVGVLGVFMHKIFTFEEEPDLRLFIGGFGQMGTLMGARLRMEAVRTDIQPIPDANHHPLSLDLTGQGWGGGGSFGLELVVAEHTALLAEAGYDFMRIPRVQMTAETGYSGVLQDGLGRDLQFDFSGWYLKLGTVHRFGPRK